MTHQEMRDKLSLHYELKSLMVAQPDWELFESYFNWKPPIVFKTYLTVFPQFKLYGGYLHAPTNPAPEFSDQIIDVYKAETLIGNWPQEMVPFLDLGSGDQYCISTINCAVYYVDFTREYHQESNSFEEWLENWITSDPDSKLFEKANQATPSAPLTWDNFIYEI